MAPRIFIGGTGLSGTSILRDTMGYHQDIHALPREMRFLVDPDGLIDLLDALTVKYSQDQAREALYKFERLMRVYLTHPQRPYPEFDMANWLGGPYYWKRLDKFCKDLIELEFRGVAIMYEPQPDEGNLVHQARQLRKIVRRIRGRQDVPPPLALHRPVLRVPRYFSDRRELTELTAAFVDDLFLYTARQNGKKTWCEKTPQNILHFDFLSELFPDSLLIHVKRDPRGVANSLTRHRWGPDDLHGACLFLRSTYERWFEVEKRIDKSRYFELKLEELAESPRDMLGRIAAFCGLEGQFDRIPEMHPERINRWKEKMTAEELQLVNEMLGPYVEQMGYEVAYQAEVTRE